MISGSAPPGHGGGEQAKQNQRAGGFRHIGVGVRADDVPDGLLDKQGLGATPVGENRRKRYRIFF